MVKGLILCSIVAVTMFIGTALAQQPAQSQLDDLETRVSNLESGNEKLAGAGYVIFLFGAFCALWAQNSGRNAWLWFLLGALLHFVTVSVLLYKNSADRKARRATGSPEP